MTVEIDPHSGFCGGVIKAIGTAEEFLATSNNHRLYSLGDIVHNEAELKSLSDQGMVTVDLDDLSQMKDASGETLLIRAHGEPPSTYKIASELGFNVIDCTCPVVLKLQKDIRQAYDRMNEGEKKGQLIIFGKTGHAEVLGLVGQVEGDALVIESVAQLETLTQMGLLHLDRPTEIFSQTTMSPTAYDEVCQWLIAKITDPSLLRINNTICGQMAVRQKELEVFAMNHDVVIFVSGKTSSNGKVLSDLCKSVNIRTYHIGDISEISKVWFREDDAVGVCGATSTPKWLLEAVRSHIENLQ